MSLVNLQTITQVSALHAMSSRHGTLSPLIIRLLELWIVSPAMTGIHQRIITLGNVRIAIILQIGHPSHLTILDLMIVQPAIHLLHQPIILMGYAQIATRLQPGKGQCLITADSPIA
jgi:hypothetical protein